MGFERGIRIVESCHEDGKVKQRVSASLGRKRLRVPFLEVCQRQVWRLSEGNEAKKSISSPRFPGYNSTVSTSVTKWLASLAKKEATTLNTASLKPPTFRMS